MDDATQGWNPATGDRSAGDRTLALVLVGFVADPRRVGECALLPPGTSAVLGRHGTLDWARQRPGDRHRTGPLSEPTLSRKQVEIEAAADHLRVRNVGRLPLQVDGRAVSEGQLRPGDLVQIADRVLLLVTHRSVELPGEDDHHVFGGPDTHGIVGESEATWAIRSDLGFLAPRNQHVLVLGPSGTGKELAARALHTQSTRGGRPLVSRSAATIPESLADAELFGNLKDYPNPGMPARPGLVGEADGSTLFLDEFGELPEDVQARLLRVLDHGEYARLGEARPSHADLRVIGATNRPLSALKHDVLARFPLRLTLPPLQERAADVPLIAAHLLRGIAATDPEIRARFFDDDQPRLSVELVRRLMTHPYTTHVRELQGLLWQAIASSTGSMLRLPAMAPKPVSRKATTPDAVDPAALTPDEIQAVLDKHNGRQDPAWRELGLSSRHVLARLVKKYGLSVRGRG